jgi:hypothetical protein
MKDIYIHFENYVEGMDKDLSIKISLPVVPRFGEQIFLTDEEETDVSLKIISSPELKERYGDLVIRDRTYVSMVRYYTEDKSIHIELSSENDLWK